MTTFQEQKDIFLVFFWNNLVFINKYGIFTNIKGGYTMNTITEKEIREKISEYLKSSGMKQKDFSEELGLTQTTFSK